MRDIAKERARFLRLLKKFDDNYTTHKGEIKKELDESCKKRNKTIKQHAKGMKAPIYSQIDYEKIKRIANRDIHNGKKNPFRYFYNLPNENLNKFFKILQDIHVFLESNFDGVVRNYTERKRLIAKYEAVINDLEYNYGSRGVEVLMQRKKLLETKPTLTKRKLFEHLLFHLWSLFAYDKEKHINIKDFKCTQKVANITNKIIKEYFEEDITFSRKMNFYNFKKYTYWTLGFEDIKTEVWHS